MKTETDTRTAEIIERARAERVRIAASRGNDPREHPAAAAITDPDEMTDLVRLALRGGVNYEVPPQGWAEARRAEFEREADHGSPIPNGNFPLQHLAHLYDDAGIADLLERQSAGAERARARRAAREQRAEIEKMTRVVQREREMAQHLLDVHEARKRLGL